MTLSRPRVAIGAWSAGCLALMLLGCGAPSRPAPAPAVAQWPRVVLLSLDGFRTDYLERPTAVRLRALAARGVRAERLVPSFPSKTFPNHYTLVTGLTPAHHGIVANVMHEPTLGLFRMSDTAAVRNPAWWGGEPLWVTAEKQGRRTAAYFWPGSETAVGGVRPTWWYPYEHTRRIRARVARILEWLAMPPAEAPALIAAYFSDTDDAGHSFGPAAPQVDSAIARVDSAVGAIVDGIARLGLTEVVNVVIVGDHGMAPVAAERVIVLDDYLDLSTVEILDQNPVAMIVPRDGDVARVMAALAGAHPRLQVYRRDALPASYRFAGNPRITPIVAVADDGWTIATRAELARKTSWGGAHGYDPALPSMGTLFVAAGPGVAATGHTIPAFSNVHVYPFVAALLGVRPARTDGSIDSVRAALRPLH